MIFGKKIKVIIGWLLAIMIIAYLGRAIYINRAELDEWQWNIDLFYALLSAILLGLAYIFAALAWRTIIYGFGQKVGLKESFRIIYLANLGRYIPGRIWQVFGMVTLANEAGIPARVSLASFVLTQVYSLPASFLLIPIFIGNLDSVGSIRAYGRIFYLFFLIIFLVFLMLFIKPAALNGVLNWALKVLKREPVEYNPELKNRLFIFVWYLMTWILFGLAFHYFLKALLPNPTISTGHAVGTYIAAYILGYLTILSPGGLGVREGVMTAMLTPFLGVPIAISISLIHRIWITISEAIISLIALLTYRFGKKSMHSPNQK